MGHHLGAEVSEGFLQLTETHKDVHGSQGVQQQHFDTLTHRQLLQRGVQVGHQHSIVNINMVYRFTIHCAKLQTLTANNKIQTLLLLFIIMMMLPLLLLLLPLLMMMTLHGLIPDLFLTVYSLCSKTISSKHDLISSEQCIHKPCAPCHFAFVVRSNSSAINFDRAETA